MPNVQCFGRNTEKSIKIVAQWVCDWVRSDFFFSRQLLVRYRSCGAKICNIFDRMTSLNQLNIARWCNISCLTVALYYIFAITNVIVLLFLFWLGSAIKHKLHYVWQQRSILDGKYEKCLDQLDAVRIHYTSMWSEFLFFTVNSFSRAYVVCVSVFLFHLGIILRHIGINSHLTCRIYIFVVFSCLFSFSHFCVHIVWLFDWCSILGT